MNPDIGASKLLALALTGAPALSAQESAEDEAYELSPFTIDSSDHTGYRATSTLAGSRLKTDLRDLGAAISVMTEVFFEDTGATDAGRTLSYGLNTEVTGDQGNYGGGTGSDRNSQDGNRVNPQSAQRIRGLTSAELTRGYFTTDIPFQ